MATNPVTHSTLYLGYSCRFTPDKNWKLDNWSVSTLGEACQDGYTPIYDFQYIKHELELTIVLNLNQYNLEYDVLKNLNYVAIQNSSYNSTLVGYFVIGKEWKGKSAVELKLHMDTVNSFVGEIQLSDRTTVKRQHKDRFKAEGGIARVNQTTTFVNSDFDFSWDDEANIGEIEYYTTPVEKRIYLFNYKKYMYDYDEEISLRVRYGFDEVHEILTCETRVYMLDANKRVITQVNDMTMPNNAEDFSLTFGGIQGNKIKYYVWYDDGHWIDEHTWVPGHWETHYYTVPSSVQYIAVECNMTFDEDDPGDEESIRVALQFIDWEYEDFDWDMFADFEAEVEDFLVGTGVYIQATQAKLYPLIDRYNEEIQPALYGVDNFKLSETGYLNQSWYLVYKNQNDPSSSLTNPVDCYLYGERPAKIYQASSYTGTYSVSQLVTLLLNLNGYNSWEELERNPSNYNTEIYLTAHDNNGGRIQGAGPYGEFSPFDYTMGSFGLVRIALGATPAPLMIQAFDANGHNVRDTMLLPSGTVTFTGCRMARIGPFTIDEWTAMGYAEYNLFGTSGSTTTTTNSILDVDRTDAKLIKIIKLPYCPSAIGVDTNGYVMYDTNTWTYNLAANTLKLTNMNAKFTRELNFTQNPFLALNPIDLDELPYKFPKDDMYETKLYHSDYYQPKFFYDSFGFTFQLELMWRFYKNYDTFKVNYNVTNTLNSRFLFSFPDYICTYNQTKDFNNILYVSRNNECAIYNQQYVNYMRDGYNYDRKANEMKYTQGWLEQNVGFVSGGISDLVGGYSSGGIGSALYGWSQGYVSRYLKGLRTQNDIRIDEIRMQQKQAQLMNQATTVSDANDVDLLDAYCGNRATYKIYQVSPRMKKALFDLFYYTGYICNEQKIPDTYTRIYFDYVMADIEIKKAPNLPEDIISDLKARYANGITFFHRWKGVIDWDQEYENWEVSLLDTYGGN